MGEAKTKRTRRTPAERAQAELDTANSIVARLEDKVVRLQGEANEALNELTEARARVAYAEQNPALGDAKPYSIDGSYDVDDYSDAEVEQAL